MNAKQIVSARFKSWTPFSDDEIAVVLRDGDERQVFDAMLLCRNDDQYARLQPRWCALTQSGNTK